MKATRKLKNKAGFTLAETLLAVLILLLVSVIVANGIPVAQNVYNKVILGANAQVLLSTTATALRNELATARNITISSDAQSVVYFNVERQAYAKIFLGEANAAHKLSEGIQLQPYVDPDKNEALTESKARNPVSRAAANGNLVITYEGIERKTDSTTGKEMDWVTFSGLKVVQEGKKDTLASLQSLDIRIISAPGTGA